MQSSRTIFAQVEYNCRFIPTGKRIKKIFTETCPKNNLIDDIILKVATLNTIYNTHIYSVYPVAHHILSPEIDDRLSSGDETLVNELMRVFYNDGGKIDHYSFATKYCSFHYPYFKRILSDFRHYFGLENYTTKELDQYLWQFGKDFF